MERENRGKGKRQTLDNMSEAPLCSVYSRDGNEWSVLTIATQRKTEEDERIEEQQQNQQAEGIER